MVVKKENFWWARVNIGSFLFLQILESTQLVMKKIWLLFAFVCLSLLTSVAQSRLDGLWEGEITYGGLHATQSYRFQLWLEVKGEYITGRSYVFISNEDVLEMEIKGRLYGDWSIYLREVAFVPMENSDVVPSYYRKYQFVFNRSIWETSLEGYWQEIFHDELIGIGKRQRGRIKLQRVEQLKP
jgi:hypothetical protein